MDFESKFSSIIRDTESNIARVKQRLGSARASSLTALHLNGAPDDGFRMSENKFSSSLPYGSNYATSSFNRSLNGPVPESSLIPSHHAKSPESSAHLALENSPGIIMILQDRMEAQNKLMEQLARTVRRLEEERDLYSKQMRQLREELALVNSRMAEKGVDLATEHKMDLWRRDMASQMQMMSSQMQLVRSQHEDLQHSQSYSGNTARESLEIKRWVMDECESVRREVDNVKSRLVKVELLMNNIDGQTRDMARRNERIDKSLNEILQSHTETSREFTRSIGERGHEQMEISELKNSLRSLRDKIGDIEFQVVDKHKTDGKYSSKERRPPRKSRSRPPPAEVLSPDSTDLDLSDTTDLADLQSSDFSISPKNQRRSIPQNVDLEDDLDLDDLELTTDDLTTLNTEDFK